MSGVRTVLLKDICNFEKGTTGLMKAVPGEYPLVTTGTERRTCESYQFDTKAVCIPLVSSTGHGHASLKNVHYQEGKFALGSILVALTAIDEEKLNIHFLYLYLSQLKDILLVPLMKGAANVSLSITAIKSLEIPLPSIYRQQQIVEKFKSIVLEERLIIEELNYQEELIKKLKQQIIQEAVQGTLTINWRENNSSKESGEVLLSKIISDTKKLIINKAIPKKTELLPLKDGDKPFELPISWTWCRLGDLVDTFLGGYAFKSTSFTKEGTNQVLRLGNIRPNHIRLNEKSVFVNNDIAKNADKAKLVVGDLLITMTGTRGKKDYCYSVLVDEKHTEKRTLYLNQRVGCLRFNNNTIPEFYNYALKVDSLLLQIFATSTGAANQANIGVKALKEWIVPLPPLNEQKQIVKKIKELLSLCNKLESYVSDNKIRSKDLIKIVLSEEFSQNKVTE